MNINFHYDKRDIDYVSGYIFKGKSYRCSYVRYKTLYENHSPGTENVNCIFINQKRYGHQL